MKDSTIYYSVGPLLYSPANNETIVSSIVEERFGTYVSLALCLEDTIRDDRVEEAEQILLHSLHTLYELQQHDTFYMMIITFLVVFYKNNHKTKIFKF